MSGLEGIGALASVAQICEYIIQGVSAVKSTFKEFKELPPVIQERTRYLNDLELIIQSISSNNSLQPDEIKPFLRTIYQHTSSLKDLLNANLKRVQEKTFKNFTHLLRNRDGDREAIVLALDNLERDKSNLSLFMVNSVGVNIAQLKDMATSGSNPKFMTFTKLEQKEAEKAKDQSGGHRLGSSGDVQQQQQVPELPKPAPAVNKRSWKKIATSGEDVNATYGDKNVRKEDRPEGGEEREWEELNTEGKGIKVVFGDENDAPVPSQQQ